MTLAEQFATWLAAAMRQANLDIDNQLGGGRVALASTLGVSRSTVSRWLDGKTLPGPEYYERIAEAVGVTPTDLLVGAGIISAESVEGITNVNRRVFLSPEEAAIKLGISPDDQELFSSFVQQLQKRAKRTGE